MFTLDVRGDLTRDELQATVAGLAGVSLERENLAGLAFAGVEPHVVDGTWREGYILSPTVMQHSYPMARIYSIEVSLPDSLAVGPKAAGWSAPVGGLTPLSQTLNPTFSAPTVSSNMKTTHTGAAEDEQIGEAQIASS